MKLHTLITQEEFDDLLRWLDPDRERAGVKYETIRRGLVEMFTHRGCRDPEDLADETINRVTRKVRQVAPDFVGDPAAYFYGVAKRLHLEYLKAPPTPAPPPTPEPDAEDSEAHYECLERCLDELPPLSRDIILLYYAEKKMMKVALRRDIGRNLNLKPGTLRVRAYRIRAQLEKCMGRCLEERGQR